MVEILQRDREFAAQITAAKDTGTTAEWTRAAGESTRAATEEGFEEIGEVAEVSARAFGEAVAGIKAIGGPLRPGSAAKALETFEAPPTDPAVAEELDAYIAKRTEEIEANGLDV